LNLKSSTKFEKKNSFLLFLRSPCHLAHLALQSSQLCFYLFIFPGVEPAQPTWLLQKFYFPFIFGAGPEACFGLLSLLAHVARSPFSSGQTKLSRHHHSRPRRYRAVHPTPLFCAGAS
jgi:hypothetical protein